MGISFVLQYDYQLVCAEGFLAFNNAQCAASQADRMGAASNATAVDVRRLICVRAKNGPANDVAAGLA
jgi:hypothetical protein